MTEHEKKERSVTFSVDVGMKHQIVRDFGASVCWWAPNLGTKDCVDRFLELLFTEEGLGLNVLRFNTGGKVVSEDGRTYYAEVRSPVSALREDGTYDITRDIGTWTVVCKAAQLGTITDFTLFMNSPPTTMTVNGQPYAERPEKEGEFVSNLRQDCYEDYAKYAVDVTEQYVNSGIPVKYVSPVNEPQWQWDDRNRQEGCHYTPQECVRIFKLVIQELRNRAEKNPKMERVRISMPETAQWWQQTYVHDMYQLMCEDPEISPWVDHFSAHSYGTTAEHKRSTKAFFETLERSIPLHQTEWAPLHNKDEDNMEFALELARVLYEDMTILHTAHWTWWLGVSCSKTWPDGLVVFDEENQQIMLPKRYFAMKHYSRFIRNCCNVEMSFDRHREGVMGSAYLSNDGGKLVVILVNAEYDGAEVTIQGASGVAPTVYETSYTRNCECLGEISVEKGYTLPPRSITNLVFQLEGE